MTTPKLTPEEVQAEMDKIEAEVLWETSTPEEKRAINNRAHRIEENRHLTSIR